ncbi:hypothetical protein L1O03_00965 [Corynebacterium uropygiale]|uniref:Oxidoreductase n=1 Tax=Corynebacterium uropygiale TaxID=1775911 RepID=A0A9X1TX80_9CORY|nr:hypothetical protein [Corynebacterium uropygiale]MCF4005750.1 hypothetical protein [Corynebacterium uropygiale]
MPSESDPLAPLLAVGDVAESCELASRAINAVHRRPVNLRKSDLTSAEAALRGAQGSALLAEGGPIQPDPEKDPAFQRIIQVYGVLGPEVAQRNAAILLRAPRQMFSTLASRAGVPARPATPDAAARLDLLSRLLSRRPSPHPGVLTQVLHAEILSQEIFGEASGPIARVLSRLCAIGTGFDPRGLCVPEAYLHRHEGEYREVIAGFPQDAEHAAQAVSFLARAWEAGAREAEGIARLASH